MFVSNLGWDCSTCCWDCSCCCRGVCPMAIGGWGVGWLSGPCSKMLGGNVVDVCEVPHAVTTTIRKTVRAIFAKTSLTFSTKHVVGQLTHYGVSASLIRRLQPTN